MIEAPTTEGADAVVVDCDLEEPPHKVWRALTEADLLAAWLGPNDIRPEVGHRFEVRPDAEAKAIACEVLEVEPQRSLRYAWRETDPDGRPVESEVTWTLIPRFDGGTRLRVVHGGFAPVLALAGARSPAAALERLLGLWADVLRLAA